MIKVVFNKKQSKSKTNGLLSDALIFMREVCGRCQLSMLLQIIAAEVLANYGIRIKRIQIEDHEIKVVNFAEENHHLLKRRCIQFEDKLFKSQTLWSVAYKNRIDQPGQMEWPQFFIKILGINFGNSIFDNSN